MLAKDQVEFYREQGFLHIPRVFTPDETRALQEDMDWMIQVWADKSPGWTGPWRRIYMDEQTERRSELVSMHKLHFYATSWMRAATHPRLCQAVGDLLGDCVELHDTTMHVKPPEAGQPFPVHQDWPFYPHADDRYADVLVHLDDTCHENGEIRFLPGSHRDGPRQHVSQFPDGTPCTPHLPTDQYRLDDTVPVPAKAGDVVVFNICTIHGSHINQTDRPRRMVRIGYRCADNTQFAGDSVGRPDVMVCGRRPRRAGQPLYNMAASAQDLENVPEMPACLLPLTT